MRGSTHKRWHHNNAEDVYNNTGVSTQRKLCSSNVDIHTTQQRLSLDVWYSNTALKNTIQLGLIEQLRMASLVRFQLHSHLLAMHRKTDIQIEYTPFLPYSHINTSSLHQISWSFMHLPSNPPPTRPVAAATIHRVTKEGPNTSTNSRGQTPAVDTMVNVA